MLDANHEDEVVRLTDVRIREADTPEVRFTSGRFVLLESLVDGRWVGSVEHVSVPKSSFDILDGVRSPTRAIHIVARDQLTVVAPVLRESEVRGERLGSILILIGHRHRPDAIQRQIRGHVRAARDAPGTDDPKAQRRPFFFRSGGQRA